MKKEVGIRIEKPASCGRQTDTDADADTDTERQGQRHSEKRDKYTTKTDRLRTSVTDRV